MASPYFYPNCSIPKVPVPYVSSANVRGSLNILFSSLATIVACTYTLLHLNVPRQRRLEDSGWRSYIRRLRLISSLKWSAFAVLIPEFILVKYVLDWFNARLQLHLLYKAFPRSKASWTLTHMLFADMGGFVVEYHPTNLSTPSTPVASSIHNVTPISPAAVEGVGAEPSATGQEIDIEKAEGAHTVVDKAGDLEDELGRQRTDSTLVASSSFDGNSTRGKRVTTALDAGQSTTRPESSPIPQDMGASFYNPSLVELWYLDAFALRRAIEEGYLTLNVPTRAEILDRSKSHAFAKLVAMFQPVYFVIEVIARAVRHLPITQLEIGVMGFVLCGAVAYGFALQKPKSVTTTITLGSYNGPIPPRFGDIAKDSTMVVLFQRSQPPAGSPNSNDGFISLSNSKFLRIFMAVGCLTTLVFGAVCLAAWDFSFRTEADRWLWRSASLVSATVFPAYAMILLPWRFIRRKDMVLTHAVFEEGILGSVALVLQSASRLIVVAEMFRCLIYLPPEAYLTTDIVNLPHIG